MLASRGWSGNALERVVLADGRVLIAKRIVPGADWIGRASADPGREGLLFTSGVLDRLPPALDHAMVAAARDGDAWWLVMRDVSDELLDDHSIVPREANRRLLAAVNEMWEGFWGERVEFLAPQAVRLQMAAPSIGRRERDGIDLLPKQLEVMWEAFAEAVDPDVAAVVLALVEDAAPLAAALDARGTTLLHGDIRDEQIGLAGRPARAPRLGARDPGPPGGRLRLAPDALRLADRRHPRPAVGGLSRGARRARRPARGRAGHDRRTRDVRLDPRPQRRHPPRSGRTHLGPHRTRLVGATRASRAGDLVALLVLPRAYGRRVRASGGLPNLVVRSNPTSRSPGVRSRRRRSKATLAIR